MAGDDQTDHETNPSPGPATSRESGANQPQEGNKVHPAVLIGFFVGFVALLAVAAIGFSKLMGGDEKPQGTSLVADIDAVMAGGALGADLDALTRQHPFHLPEGNQVDAARLDALMRVRQRLLPKYRLHLDMLQHVHTSSADRTDRPGFDTIGMLASFRRDHLTGLQAEGMSLAEYGWLASLVFERVLPPTSNPPHTLERPASIPRCEGPIPAEVVQLVRERAFEELRLEYVDDLLIATAQR